VRLAKPNVYGAVSAFEGQVTVFWAPHGPCLRCLFPEPPPPNLIPTCAEAGVLGAVPGIIGSFQALEVVKLISGAGKPLMGRFLAMDGLGLRVREIKLSRNPECPVCAEARLHGDLEEMGPACTAASTVHEPVTPEELRTWQQEGQSFTLLDIRPADEATLPGAISIPAEELAQRLSELPTHRPIVVCCRYGFRSLAAVDTLRAHGFRHVLFLKGGIEALQ
jgi:adenylyltransferase/sulfurtransferase